MKQSIRLGLASVSIADVIGEIQEGWKDTDREKDVLRECRIALNALKSAIVILDPKAYEGEDPPALIGG